MATQTANNPAREKMLKGLSYQKSGEIEKAQRCYKQVLKKSPNHPDALHLLGVTYRQQGYPKRAVEYIQKAIKANSNQAPFYANLARAMMDIGTDPGSLVAVSDKALSINPTEREALNIKGISLTALEEWETAEETFHTLLKSHPGFAEGYQNYGLLMRKQKEFEKAALFFQKAVQMMPEVVVNYVELARCRMELEDFQKSLPELVLALKKFPKDGDILHEYARLNFKMGEVQRGLPYAEEAISENPLDPHRRVTLGVMRYSVGDFSGAIDALNSAREVAKTDIAAADWNLSLSHMAAGDLEKAWQFHKARFADDAATVVRRVFDVPEWDGSPLSNKKIMIWNDQGVGDAIRNATLVHDVLKVHDDVIFEAPIKLASLFKRSFPDALVRPSHFDAKSFEATIHDYDTHCCVTDLVGYFRKDFASFSQARRPYLKFDLEKARLLHDRLGKNADKPVVGVAWRSGNLAPWRARWYLSIMDFGPIFETPEVTFVNLQYGALEKEINWVRKAKGIDFHAWEDVDLRDDMETAAALTACVDLVITANTSVGDLAGALDIPCWRFGSLSTVILLGQENPPWYPSTKYFRITPDQRAQDIVPDLEKELRAFVSTIDIEQRRDRLQLD